MNDLKPEFSKAFLEKHGKKIYDAIIETIRNETNKKIDVLYIELIFRTALLEYIGLENDRLENFIKDILNKSDYNIEDFRKKHKNSINIIIDNIEEAIDDFNN